MVAYPMMRALPYSEFIEKLQSLGVGIHESKTILEKTEKRFKYLEYTKDGKTRTYPMTFSSEEEMVQFSVIRSICTNLELDPALFGLHLG